MNGVVHVGAHKGEEVPMYLSEGRSPIICFEPQNFGGKAFQVALGDYDGTMTLRIPHHLHETNERDTMSASGLPVIPENAIANGWTPTPCDEIKVPVRRFDNWAASSGFQRGSCSLLVIDVQGMELQVLEGFGSHLNEFSNLKVECSEPSLYEGGASGMEVVKFLESHKFVKESPVLRHGDVHFRRAL